MDKRYGNTYVNTRHQPTKLPQELLTYVQIQNLMRFLHHIANKYVSILILDVESWNHTQKIIEYITLFISKTMFYGTDIIL